MSDLEKVFIISYPKMGRTWLRVLLSRYVQQLLGADEFELKLHDRGSLQPYITPQFIFTHAMSGYEREQYSKLSLFLSIFGLMDNVSYPFDLSVANGQKVIFLVRDPRDTLVSHYLQLTKRQKDTSLPRNLYIGNRLMGLPRMVAFLNISQSWKEHSESLYVFYEDIKQNPEKELVRILEFANIVVKPEIVSDSVIFANFDNMKKMEMTKQYGVKLSPNDDKDTDSFKVRKGQVGRYKDELSVRNISYINKYIDENLHPFYERYKSIR